MTTAEVTFDFTDLHDGDDPEDGGDEGEGVLDFSALDGLDLDAQLAMLRGDTVGLPDPLAHPCGACERPAGEPCPDQGLGVPRCKAWYVAAVGDDVQGEFLYSMRVLAAARALDAEAKAEEDDAFWRRSKFLTAVLRAARARRVGPYALLAAVLARAAAHVPPSAVLPPTRGTPASLNIFSALVGESGAGKSAALGLGREFLRVEGGFGVEPVEGLPGSGEGIAAAYVAVRNRPREEGGGKELVRVATSVLFTSDEIGSLDALGGRTGSTLLPTLRTAWSGGLLGNRNASAETTRYVEAGTYRFALAVGVQPELAGAILDDKASGWAQRWIWMPTYDKQMRPPEDLRVLDFEPWRWRVPKPREMQLPDEAVRLILKAASVANREIGTKPPDLDGHALLTRAKVAALLALLGGSARRISSGDWAAAGELMEISDKTRAEVDVARKAARDRADYGKGLAAGTTTIAKAKRVDEHHVRQGAKTILRRLERAEKAGRPWVTERDAKKALRSDLRKYSEQAIALLVKKGEATRERREYKPGRKTAFVRIAEAP